MGFPQKVRIIPQVFSSSCEWPNSENDKPDLLEKNLVNCNLAQELKVYAQFICIGSYGPGTNRFFSGTAKPVYFDQRISIHVEVHLLWPSPGSKACQINHWKIYRCGAKLTHFVVILCFEANRPRFHLENVGVGIVASCYCFKGFWSRLQAQHLFLLLSFGFLFRTSCCWLRNFTWTGWPLRTH